MNEQPSSRRLRTGAAVIAASLLSAFGAVLAVGTGASGRSTPSARTVTQTTTAASGGSGSVLDVSNVAAAGPTAPPARSASVATIHSPLPEGAATGSGFIIDTSGDIVTNEHVVENARRVTVSFGSSSPAQRIRPRVVGTHPP